MFLSNTSFVMATIFLAIIFGLAIAYFAIQNTHLVTVTLANYAIPGTPLYVIAIAAMVFGLVVGLIFNVVNSIATSVHLRKKNSAIAGANQSINALKNKINDLEAENADLRDKLSNQETVEKHEVIEERPQYEEDRTVETHHSLPFFTRLRESFR